MTKAAGTDFQRGLNYLYALRLLLPQPDLIDLMLWPLYRDSASAWIGAQVDDLNAQLAELLEVCHQAVAPAERPSVQLYATPLAARFGLDGLCYWPISQTGAQTEALILLDLGTLEPQDWLALLVHEYAHAICRLPGHGQLFQQQLAALCRTLNLELSPTANWNALPLYPRRPDRIAFWLGETPHA